MGSIYAAIQLGKNTGFRVVVHGKLGFYLSSGILLKEVSLPTVEDWSKLVFKVLCYLNHSMTVEEENSEFIFVAEKTWISSAVPFGMM